MNRMITVDLSEQRKTYDLSRTNTVVKETKSELPYSNPLPHVLMLTAIVVGVATTSLALSLVVRVNEAYGTIEEDDLLEKEAAA